MLCVHFEVIMGQFLQTTASFWYLLLLIQATLSRHQNKFCGPRFFETVELLIRLASLPNPFLQPFRNISKNLERSKKKHLLSAN